MNTRQLSEVCEVVQGGRLKLSGNDFVTVGYPAYGAGGLNGYLDRYEFDRDAVILSSIGARCGKCFLAEGAWVSLANTQVILPSANVNTRFLWYQLNDERRWPRSGTAQPFIKPSDVKRHRVYLPPLDEQRRIAAILDQADALRRNRREALAGASRLKWATFTDLFGDSSENPQSWPVMRISQLTASSQYGSSDKAGGEGAFPMLRMGNITSEGDWKLDELKYINLASADIPKYTVKAGDILFNRTNSPDLVGKTAVFRENLAYAFAGYLVRLRLNELVHPEYLSAYLNSSRGKGILRGMCKSIIGMANINAKELGTIRLPVPPIELQRRFAAIMLAIRDEEAKQKRHLSHLDALFASLQQRAFSGELSAAAAERALDAA